MDELRKDIKSVWLKIKQLRDAKDSAEQLIDLLLETAKEKNAPARIQVDGKKRNLRLNLKRPTLHGISYAHFMACPAKENPGLFVEWVKASK